MSVPHINRSSGLIQKPAQPIGYIVQQRDSVGADAWRAASETLPRADAIALLRTLIAKYGSARCRLLAQWPARPREFRERPLHPDQKEASP